jgi:hypothetical protein
MKNNLVLLIAIILFGFQYVFAQKESEKNILLSENKPIYLESGINLSIPAHDDMMKTHLITIGFNVKAAKKISKKWDMGIRAEYDYRFTRKNIGDITAESTLKERALHTNFSLISIKPGVQYNFNSKFYCGAETGIGYAISDYNSKIGLGFVEEYDGHTQFGSCSGLYLGKYYLIGPKDQKIGLSLSWTNFFAEDHSENSIGIKINFRILN